MLRDRLYSLIIHSAGVGGWKDERTDRQIERRTDERMNSQTDRRFMVYQQNTPMLHPTHHHSLRGYNGSFFGWTVYLAS